MNEKQLDLDEISQTFAKPHYSSQSILSMAAAHLPKSALIVHTTPARLLGPAQKAGEEGAAVGHLQATGAKRRPHSHLCFSICALRPSPPLPARTV